MVHLKGYCSVCHTKQDVINDVIMPHVYPSGNNSATVICPGHARPPERRKPAKRCAHLHTRCVHGDEINQRMKVHSFRFWKKDVVVRRQVCTDCGKALERPAICSATGRDLHIWTGPWEF